MYNFFRLWRIYVCMYQLEHTVCISVEELFILKPKKGFRFFSLRSENNLIDAKRKIGSEKMRKNRTEFFK
jgi:hypothetical protein